MTGPPGRRDGGITTPDPFADDPVMFTITARNMDTYADKLTEGAQGHA